MNIETWSLFFVAYLLITLAPGPSVLFVVKNALQYGYREALLSIFGNLTSQLIIVLLVAGGAGILLAQSPAVFFGLKVIGGIYLIYLGVSGLLSKKNPAESQVTRTVVTKANGFSIYKKGFLVSASNPKTVIFLSAFLPQFIVAEQPVALQFMVMFISICFSVISIHLMYSYLSKNIKSRVGNSRLKEHFSKLYNSIFIAFGGALLFNNSST